MLQRWLPRNSEPLLPIVFTTWVFPCSHLLCFLIRRESLVCVVFIQRYCFECEFRNFLVHYFPSAVQGIIVPFYNLHHIVLFFCICGKTYLVNNVYLKNFPVYQCNQFHTVTHLWLSNSYCTSVSRLGSIPSISQKNPREFVITIFCITRHIGT